MTVKWIAVIAAVAAAAGGAAYVFGPDRDAPGAEAKPMTGGAMVEVTLPVLSDAARIGERAFNARCATCHGADAAGQDGVAPPLIHKIYEPGHHGDAAFLLAARRGVRAHHWRFGDMPPVENITEAEIAGIISYVREVQRANGIY